LSKQEVLTQITDALATDLWHRFRALALVLDQADRFVGLSPTGETVDSSGRWLAELSQRPEEIDDIARDLLLRALRTAVEPVNFAILENLARQPTLAVTELMEITGLNRLSLNERVNDLIQVGLASKDVQTDQVQATQAALAVAELVGQAQRKLSERIRENPK